MPRSKLRECGSLSTQTNKNRAEVPCNVSTNNIYRISESVKYTLRIFLVLAAIGFLLSQFYYNYTVMNDLYSAKKEIRETKKHLLEVARRQNSLELVVEQTVKKLSDLGDKVDSFMDREMNLDLGKIDYALDGKILSTGAENGSTAVSEHVCSYCTDNNFYSAQVMLMPAHFPGDCWSVEIENAIAVIELTAEIYVQSITLEHIHASKSPSGKTTSAPKFFSMWGVKDNKDAHFLGSFAYDNAGPSVQTFPVNRSSTPYKVVKLQIFTNHGNPDYTCIYRLRVHGEPSCSKKK